MMVNMFNNSRKPETKMDFLIRFGDNYHIVKANNKSQIKIFMKINYALSPDDYGITQATVNDIEFVKNNGGQILKAKRSESLG